MPWQGSDAVTVEPGAIPVRRGILDLVAFRSHDRLRAQLLGPASKPDRRIPGREKAARLGEAGRLHLHQCVAQFRADLTPRTCEVLRRHFGEAMLGATTARIRETLLAYGPRLQAHRHELTAERAALAALHEPLQRVAASSTELQQKLLALRHQFDRDTEEKRVVLEPQRAPTRPEPAAPAKGRLAQPGAREP